MKIVLDTHIIIFANSGRLSEKRIKTLENEKNELYVSQISLWEITKLYELKRIATERSLEHLLVSIYYHKRFNLIELNPAVLLKLAEVSPKMLKDPADQLIVASALSINAALMSDDQQIKTGNLVEII